MWTPITNESNSGTVNSTLSPLLHTCPQIWVPCCMHVLKFESLVACMSSNLSPLLHACPQIWVPCCTHVLKFESLVACMSSNLSPLLHACPQIWVPCCMHVLKCMDLAHTVCKFQYSYIRSAQIFDLGWCNSWVSWPFTAQFLRCSKLNTEITWIFEWCIEDFLLVRVGNQCFLILNVNANYKWKQQWHSKLKFESLVACMSSNLSPSLHACPQIWVPCCMHVLKFESLIGYMPVLALKFDSLIHVRLNFEYPS